MSIETFLQFMNTDSRLEKIPANVLVNIRKQKFPIENGVEHILYLERRPISSSEITSAEPLKLRFGNSFPLFSVGLHLGYLFEFPKCEILDTPLYTVAKRRPRDRYKNVTHQLSKDNLIVLGTADATLIITKHAGYSLLPEFSNI